MQKRWLMTTLSILLITGLVVAVIMVFRLGGLVPPVTTLAAHAVPVVGPLVQGNGAQMAGDYSGVVQLQVVVAGRYSDTLNTQPAPDTPDLGAMDLALKLTQNSTALSGYVILDKTLIFTVEHTIQEAAATVKTGPTLSGSFDGTNFTLISERVDATLSGAAVQRQFRLTGAIAQADGSKLTGEYRETVWEGAHQPVTVVGTFILQRPLFATALPDTSNQVPELVADMATTVAGAAVTISVLSNDTDVNGDMLTITAVSKPQFGTATTDGQQVTYTPNPTFGGEDHFTYFVSDGKGGTSAGVVTITVTGGTPSNGSKLHLPLIQR